MTDVNSRALELFPFGENAGEPVNRRQFSKSFKSARSRTKQAFRDGSRIDTVLKRYAAVGIDASFAPSLFAQGLARAPFGVDVGRDFQAQMNTVVAVQAFFDGLPARVRERFRTPVNFVDFMNDPGNREEAEKLGLVKPVEKPASPAAPPAVPPVTPAVSPAVPPS